MFNSPVIVALVPYHESFRGTYQHLCIAQDLHTVKEHIWRRRAMHIGVATVVVPIDDAEA